MALRALTPPTGRGAYRPPCPALLARYAGCDARPVDPLGGLQPPALRAVPPASLHKEVGLRFFIQLGQAREAGASGPEGKGARGACAQLWNPRPAGGGCPHLYGVGSKVVHTRARVFL